MQCLSTALAENFKPPNNYILNPLGVKTLFVPEKLALMMTPTKTRSAMMDSAIYSL